MDEVISRYNIGRRIGQAYAAFLRINGLASCSAALNGGFLTAAQEAYYRGFIAGWWEATK